MKVTEKHALWLRWNHWLNFPLLTLMIWSGILIYWANRVYPFFFPHWFYKTFHIEQRLAEGMAIHFSLAWLFIGNGILYVSYLLFSKHWRELFPSLHSLKNLLPTILHDMGLRKEAPPQGKFNAAQQLAYSSILLLGIVEVLSGFAIYKPVQLAWLAALFGGYETARLIHFIVMISFCLFFVMHVLQVIRAGWNNFRAMVAGFEVEKDE